MSLSVLVLVGLWVGFVKRRSGEWKADQGLDSFGLAILVITYNFRITSISCRITLATFPAPTPTSTSTPTPSTSSSTSTTDASASFDLEPQSKTYAQLTEIFQRMRRANGGTGLDGVLVWMPSGVVGGELGSARFFLVMRLW